MGEVLKSAALRGQIARFLHKHKDEESVADSVSKPYDERNACGT